MTTLVVLGASGATGRHVVDTALAAGHAVRTPVRRPGTHGPTVGLTEHLWPDVDDVDGLAAVLDGADAVISALGGASRGPTTVCTRAMRSTVAAMERTGVRRLVVVSAFGAAESRDRSLYSRAVWAGVADRMRDKESMEEVVRGSTTDWTIVRPPRLDDGPASSGVVVGASVPMRLWSVVGRLDLARYLVDAAVSGRHVGTAPGIRR